MATLNKDLNSLQNNAEIANYFASIEGSVGSSPSLNNPSAGSSRFGTNFEGKLGRIPSKFGNDVIAKTSGYQNNPEKSLLEKTLKEYNERNALNPSAENSDKQRQDDFDKEQESILKKAKEDREKEIEELQEVRKKREAENAAQQQLEEFIARTQKSFIPVACVDGEMFKIKSYIPGLKRSVATESGITHEYLKATDNSIVTLTDKGKKGQIRAAEYAMSVALQKGWTDITIKNATPEFAAALQELCSQYGINFNGYAQAKNEITKDADKTPNLDAESKTSTPNDKEPTSENQESAPGEKESVSNDKESKEVDAPDSSEKANNNANEYDEFEQQFIDDVKEDIASSPENSFSEPEPTQNLDPSNVTLSDIDIPMDLNEARSLGLNDSDNSYNIDYPKDGSIATVSIPSGTSLDSLPEGLAEQAKQLDEQNNIKPVQSKESEYGY